MQPKGNFNGGLQPVFNALTIVGILGLFGFFAWHTAQYMDLIFSQTGSDPRDLSQDISAGLVQAVTLYVVIRVVYFLPRGGGQKKDDDEGLGENPSDG